MTNNSSLTKARQRKNDEYFTPYEAIAAVVNSMPDIFRNKVIYCNCESGGMSAFTRFFKENFDALGLEQLIVTGLGSNQSFHKTKDSEYHVTHESSGSYASPEFQELLEQADIVITNPPFSSFKDYFSYILSKKKDFLIVAPVHSLCYKNVFPFIKDESVWPLRFDRTSGFSRPDGAKQTFGNIVWLTNLGERPENRFLDTDCSYNPNLYPHYRNVDAIEVNSVEMIPKDYPGVMAVPSSFLPYMNRQQFELLGFSHDTKFLREFGARPIGHEVISMMKRKGMTGHYSANMVNPYIVEGDKISFPYSRIFIRNKQLNKKKDTSLISGDVSKNHKTMKRGYTSRSNGTSISENAYSAEESGTFTAGRFRINFKLSKPVFSALLDLGIVENSEWHHTGKTFKKSDFFSWKDSAWTGGDSEYEFDGHGMTSVPVDSLGAVAIAHQKELNQLGKELESSDWTYHFYDGPSIPTIDSFIRGEQFKACQLTLQEEDAKSKEHSAISLFANEGLARDSRRLMHERVDLKYKNILEQRKSDFLKENKGRLENEYYALYSSALNAKAEADRYNLEHRNEGKEGVLLRIADIFSMDRNEAVRLVTFQSEKQQRILRSTQDVRKNIDGSDDVAMIIVDSNNKENINLNLSSMEKDLTNGYVVRKGQIEPLGEREKAVLDELHQAIKDNIWDKGHSDAKKGYEEYVFSSKNYEIIIRPDDESQKKYGPEVLWKPLTELSHSFSAFIAPKDDYEAAVEYARAYPDTRKEFYNQFSYGNGHQSNLEYFFPDKTVVSGNGNMFVQAQIGDKLTEPVHLDHKDREAFLNGWATAEQLGAKNIGNLIPSLRRAVEREHIREDFQPIYNKLQESLQHTIDKVGREKGKRIEFNEEIFFPVKDLELPNFGKVDWIIFSRNDWTDKTIPIEFENDNKYNRLVNLSKEDVAVFKDYVNSHDFSQDFEKSVKVSMEQSGTPYYYFDKPDYAHVHHLRQDILSALRNEDFNSLSNSIYKQYELMGGRVGREELKSLLNISDMSKGDLFNDAKDNADHAFYEKYHDEKKFIDLDDPRRDDHALEAVQKAFHPLTVDENRVDIILAENAGNPEVLDTIDKLINKDESFRYQMLDRMRSDMAYFIDNKGSENQLWSHDAKSQLIYMKALWYSLPERPHWLSMEQINDFQSRAMRQLDDRASDNKGYEVNLHNAVNSVSFKEMQTMAIRYGGKAAVVNGEEIAIFSHEDSARMFKDDILKLDQERTAVYEKKEYPVQGLEGYSRTELKQMVVDYTKDKLSEAEINDVEIVDAAIHGSRGRGTASSGSDLDVVIEYRGNQKEDAIFNLLHESNFEINGIKVDINPITESETGSLAKYMETSRKYDDNILVGNVVLEIEAGPGKSRVSSESFKDIRGELFSAIDKVEEKVNLTDRDKELLQYMTNHYHDRYNDVAEVIGVPEQQLKDALGVRDGKYSGQDYFVPGKKVMAHIQELAPAQTDEDLYKVLYEKAPGDGRYYQSVISSFEIEKNIKDKTFLSQSDYESVKAKVQESSAISESVPQKEVTLDKAAEINQKKYNNSTSSSVGNSSNKNGNSSQNPESRALDRFAEMMIEKIESIQSDWQKPWFTKGAMLMPVNMDKRPYNGFNSLMLILQQEKEGYKLPVWATFNRITSLNYEKDKQGVVRDAKDSEGNKLPLVSINKGEKSFPVFLTTFTVVDRETKEKIKHDDYKNLSSEEKEKYYVYPKQHVFNVFNIDQTNLKETRPEIYQKIQDQYTLSPDSIQQQMDFPPIDTMIKENLWICPIKPIYGDKAYYSISKEEIVVPEKKQFKDGESFYSNLFHEMGHSTGAAFALDRLKLSTFGDEEYAKEELVAELTAALTASKYGMEKNINSDSAAYIKSWLKTLKEDPSFIKTVLVDVKNAHKMIDDRVQDVSQELDKGILADFTAIREKNADMHDLNPKITIPSIPTGNIKPVESETKEEEIKPVEETKENVAKSFHFGR